MNQLNDHVEELIVMLTKVKYENTSDFDEAMHALGYVNILPLMKVLYS